MRLLITALAFLISVSLFGQDSIDEKITYDLLDFDMVWYPNDNRGVMYFQNNEYQHIVDLGSIWFSRTELDILHNKIVECLDYTNDKSKSVSATWNLPNKATIKSNKEYKWNWLTANDGEYKVIRKGKGLREKVNEGFLEFKNLIDK